jgi:hypothetical protein
MVIEFLLYQDNVRMGGWQPVFQRRNTCFVVARFIEWFCKEPHKWGNYKLKTTSYTKVSFGREKVI